ncbi:MFS transporter [Sphingosinicella sp.]|uniref:MFS transporter n=1 Tax=Sphingosinicella sp. TaxID=1917971 RepID=UPI0035B02DC7
MNLQGPGTAEHWTTRQKMVLALCALAIILDGFDTQVIGFAAPALLADWPISKADLAPILGIGLAGMMLGAALGGYIADRLGRRVTMIGSVMTFGLASGAMALAGNLLELGFLRLIAGLGLGAAFPVATALVAEFTPANRRSLAISISILCVPAGGILGGLFAAPLLPVIGWRGMFVIAGVLPLCVAILLAFFLPESPSFLRSRNVARSEPEPESEEQARQPRPHTKAGSSFFRTVSEKNLRADTILLWGAFTVGLLSNYLYFNWLPVLLTETGFDISASSIGLLVFNIGGVAGGLGAGLLTMRLGTRIPLSLVAGGGGLSALAIALFPLSPHDAFWLLPALALQGFCLGGTQILLYALAAHVFPVEIRATGIGIASSVGRLGAVISTTLGALVLAWGSTGFFLTIGAAMAAGTVCILAIKRHDPAGRSRPADSMRT